MSVLWKCSTGLEDGFVLCYSCSELVLEYCFPPGSLSSNSWLVTTIAIPQVVECIFTFPSKCYWHALRKVGSRIEDRSILYWVIDRLNLHSNLSCLAEAVLFSQIVRVLQSSSCLGSGCLGVDSSFSVQLTDLL